jgi:uncharacterized protein YejL (UPF0352 family)
MEEDTVELFDYFRVIWKRKILIIVVILVCIGVGVGVLVKKSRLKISVIYNAKTVVKIGQKVVLTQPSGVSSPIAYIENPGNLEETIPLRYGIKVKENPGYRLDIKQVGALSMLAITMTGPDSGVERALKEIIDMLIEEHRRKTNISLVVYTNYIKKLESDAVMFRENIELIEASINEIKKREVRYLEKMAKNETETKEVIHKTDEAAFLNMLYLRTIDRERDLSSTRERLRNAEYQLIVHQTTIGSFEEHETEMLGEIQTTTMIKEGSTRRIILVAGVAGLIMSLLVAFSMEYIEESKSKRKRK